MYDQWHADCLDSVRVGTPAKTHLLSNSENIQSRDFFGENPPAVDNVACLGVCVFLNYFRLSIFYSTIGFIV